MAETKPPFAWQPLTPRGVAAFAQAKPGRLLLAQLLFALMASASVVWFLSHDWFPVVTDAINSLPEQGEIRHGRLDWTGDWPTVLSENRFLSMAIDLDHSGEARTPSDVQVEFGESDVKVFSILGFQQWKYPRERNLAFNYADLAPWWGAWRPMFLGMAALLTLGFLFVSWTLLTSLYCGPAWLLAFYANRDLGFGASWRLCGAALMPGALLFTFGILMYSFGAIDLVKLGAVAGAHFLAGWVYVVLGTLASPHHTQALSEKKNPFNGGEKQE